MRSAADALDGDARVGAVGGIFHGLPGGGLLGLLQRMEYQRYAAEIARRHYQAVVLTGAGTLFRVGVLREVCEARRAGRISGGDSYYSLASLTEDDEMTKAVKTLGYRTVSPSGRSRTRRAQPHRPLSHRQLATAGRHTPDPDSAARRTAADSPLNPGSPMK